MVVDFNWSGGFVLGVVQTDEAIVETGEEEYEFCSAVLIHLGFFTMALIFV